MLKSLGIVGGLGVAVIMTAAMPVLAEQEVPVARDSNGRVYTADMDSREFYQNSNGVTQVDFSLSTEGDGYWHDATASCNPYDVKSEFYGWDWSGTRSYAAGTVGGDIARAVCAR
ncbi:hypothetical protein L3556_08470 [Candidatus Synechococcus calcipolaris G9]|uniref:Lactococcin 972 family bacteriocin n=1 Tax=Candidatus Synechococcus calcipolaris G9 TaxID=1497997 RepID=A0ABT6EZF8_9SYNE|nr:hypothetical protein [Candidatus Synechococcus calcipolaris]MDG2990959.1 hypothetical protein [Candidatus Synechococcus calcipolaris G9]